VESPRDTLVPGVAEKAATARNRDSVDLGSSENLRYAQRLAEMANRTLRYKRDQDTGRITAEVVDRDTGEVIRTIPPDDVVKLSARMADAINLMFGHHGDHARPEAAAR
jgi:flagellar protein FlaG